MDEFKKFIVKKLIGDSRNNFIFDEKEVRHRDSTFSETFFINLAYELGKALDINVEGTYVKREWTKMSQRFVALNLKKLKKKTLSNNEEEFYRYLLFLEKYISNKNHSVHETQDRKSIIYEVYDELMGHVEVIPPSTSESSLSKSDKLKNQEDVSSDTENLEFLDDYKDIVMQKLLSTHTTSRDIQSVKDKNQKQKNITKKYPESNYRKYRAQTPLISVIDDVRKDEAYFASLRTKNEIFALVQRQNTVANIVNILNSALLESKCFQVIVDAINDFEIYYL